MDFNVRVEQLYEDMINLGYSGFVKKENFHQAFTSSQPNMLFVNIAAWLSAQLAEFSNVESKISAIEEGDDLLGFMVEISSLLKELNCPIRKLTSGSLENRLSNPQDQVDALSFFCSELQAAKLIYLRKPKESVPMKIELEESRTAKELKEMLIALSFGKPPDNITPQMLFGGVDKKIKQLSHPSTPKEFVGERLFSGCLTEKQWFQIDDLYNEICKEYETRRRLLITRLEVTAESFMWSDRLKSKADEIRNEFNKGRSQLSLKPQVKISDILAASADLLTIEKTSSAAVRKNTKSRITKVIIGAVPDRGGRPEEQQPPPPEIPSWQKNDSSSSRGGFKSTDNRSRQPDYSNQQGRQGQYQSNRDSDRQRRDQPYRQDNSGQHYKNQDPYNMNSIARQPPINSMGGGGTNYNPVYTPVQQANPYTSQFGFGGYGPAGDNFSQFGMGGYGQPSSGDGSRGGGGGRGNFRGSRPFRGNQRGGRNRY